MRARLLPAAVLLLSIAAAAPASAAQEHGAPAAAPAAPVDSAAAAPNAADLIMTHITDAKHFEVPCPNSHLACVVHLPTWKPIHIGGLTIDLSPTKHVVMLLVVALLLVAVMWIAARDHARDHAKGRAPHGAANIIEAMILYLRNEVILPNVGPHGEKFVPLILTLFFFILFANAIGLLPYGATPTGNIAVTASLALITFVTIEIAGMRALGWGYLNTIVYWPHGMPLYMKVLLSIVLTPVELIGKFTKPFALTIRLFANMTAGHVVVLAFIGMIFTFGSWLVLPGPLLMAVGIMLLEVLVAFIQAFIFTLLSSVFIGQIRTAHH